MAPDLAQPSAPRAPAWWRLPPGDLLLDRVFRRIWLSTLLGALGSQVTLLALPLAAAVMLAATPMQMGWLTAMESLPFVLFSLPAGVWLDRVRKLPVYVAGEWTVAAAVASVPLAWSLGVLGMPCLYAVAFVLGSVTTVAGSAAQIVVVQAVPRERLVEAQSKSAFAYASAEVVGPGLAGMLVRLVGAPLALLVDAVVLMASAAFVRRLHLDETLAPAARGGFIRELMDGLRFVYRHPLLRPLALTVGAWQLCYHGVLATQILLATRTLGLSEQAVGLAYIGTGLGWTLSSVLGNRIDARFGPGPALVLGLVLTALGWVMPTLVPGQGAAALAAFFAMLLTSGFGAALVFINFLALRQAVTPPPLLGRMTTTMRWLVLAPAVPGALLGGWLGGHWNLRTPLLFAACLCALLALAAWRCSAIRSLRTLPAPADDGAAG